jgi:hypothetical protein
MKTDFFAFILITKINLTANYKSRRACPLGLSSLIIYHLPAHKTGLLRAINKLI